MTFDDTLHLLGRDMTFGAFCTPLEDDVTFLELPTPTRVAF
jgi:hypothetical protein